MGFFTDMLEVVERYSDHNIVMRNVRIMEQGLCTKCGEPTGAPKGYIKMFCESCSKKWLTLLPTQETK